MGQDMIMIKKLSAGYLNYIAFFNSHKCSSPGKPFISQQYLILSF